MSTPGAQSPRIGIPYSQVLDKLEYAHAGEVELTLGQPIQAFDVNEEAAHSVNDKHQCLVHEHECQHVTGMNGEIFLVGGEVGNGTDNPKGQGHVKTIEGR